MKRLQKFYTDLGFVTFPVNESKKPITETWRYLDESIPAPKGNIGVKLRPDIIVVDIDPRNGGGESFKDLSLLVDFPATLTIKTGGGGRHLYYSKPEVDLISKHLKEYKGLDFLSDGHYVVGAGSAHESGNKYEIIYKSDIKPCPTDLLKMLERPDGAIMHDVDLSDIDTHQAGYRFYKYLENEDGAEKGQRDDTFYRHACYGRDLGLTESLVFNILREAYNPKCPVPLTDSEVQATVNHAFKYAQSTPGAKAAETQFKEIEVQPEEAADITSKGALKPTLNNAVMIMKRDENLDKLFRLNTQSKNIVFSKMAPWHGDITDMSSCVTDMDEINLKYYLSVKHRIEMHISVIREAISVQAHKYQFNPLHDYLNSLSWDKVQRLDTWLIDICQTDDTLYTREIGRKFLMGAVKRAFEPACKFDQMLIMESEEGYGKSTLCEILGKADWYCSIDLDPSSKDTASVIAGKWIVELAEMECTRKADANAMKAFLTRKVDRVRPAFGHNVVDFQRSNVFIGTFNPDNMGLLKSDMGARRFWPIKVGQIRLDLLRTIVDQLWAEAVYAYKERPEDATYLQDKEVIAMALQEVQGRQIIDPWDEHIADYLHKSGLTRTRPDDIWINCFNQSMRNFGKVENSRIVTCLTSMGWRPKVYKENGRTKRGYEAPVHKEQPIAFDMMELLL